MFLEVPKPIAKYTVLVNTRAKMRDGLIVRHTVPNWDAGLAEEVCYMVGVVVKARWLMPVLSVAETTTSARWQECIRVLSSWAAR